MTFQGNISHVFYPVVWWGDIVQDHAMIYIHRRATKVTSQGEKFQTYCKQYCLKHYKIVNSLKITWLKLFPNVWLLSMVQTFHCYSSAGDEHSLLWGFATCWLCTYTKHRLIKFLTNHPAVCIYKGWQNFLHERCRCWLPYLRNIWSQSTAFYSPMAQHYFTCSLQSRKLGHQQWRGALILDHWSLKSVAQRYFKYDSWHQFLFIYWLDYFSGEGYWFSFQWISPSQWTPECSTLLPLRKKT